MASQLNDLFTGLFEAGKNIANAYAVHSRRMKLQDLFDTGIKELKNIMKPQVSYKDEAGNIIPRSKVRVDDPYITQTSTVDTGKGINTLFSAIEKILPFGEDANPYISLMRKQYDVLTPPDVEPGNDNNSFRSFYRSPNAYPAK